MVASANCSPATIGQAERGRHIPSEALVRVWDDILQAHPFLGYYEDMRHEERLTRLDASQRSTLRSAPDHPIPGDHSEWIADITVPDGTLMTPGQRFTKICRVRNAGTGDWTYRFLKRLGPTAGGGYGQHPGTDPRPRHSRRPHRRPSRGLHRHIIEGYSVAHFKFGDADANLYFPTAYSGGVVLAITVIDLPESDHHPWTADTTDR